jgi:cytochrome c oxidase subunit 3
MALRSFKKGMVARSQNMILVTLLLGIAFGILQYMGFKALYAQDIRVDGNPSESFLFIIAGLHLLHILGGIVALFIVFIRNKIKGLNNKNATGLEVIATYWHFVDLLWIYLFSFFLLNQ